MINGDNVRTLSDQPATRHKMKDICGGSHKYAGNMLCKYLSEDKDWGGDNPDEIYIFLAPSDHHMPNNMKQHGGATCPNHDTDRWKTWMSRHLIPAGGKYFHNYRNKGVGYGDHTWYRQTHKYNPGGETLKDVDQCAILKNLNNETISMENNDQRCMVKLHGENDTKKNTVPANNEMYLYVDPKTGRNIYVVLMERNLMQPPM